MNYKLILLIFIFMSVILIYLYTSYESSSDDDRAKINQPNDQTTSSYMSFMNSRPGGLRATMNLKRFLDS